MPRYLSGIQPSGDPHLGNYFGAIHQHLEAASQAEPGSLDALFFIADYHALTTIHDRAELERNVRSVAATYLSLGLDTERAVFFRQSDIPEVTELTWLLACCTGMGLLERAHSYKDKTAKGIKPSVGLFTYPVLMAADILIYDSEVVPVGKDQVQHVEMAQDMCGHFNARYAADPEKPLLVKPDWQLSPTPKVPGVDGEKMSKSYNNTIRIFEGGKPLKKAVNRIVTDSREPSEPKDPDSIPAYAILELFLDDEGKKDWRDRIAAGGENGPGYGHIKKAIMEHMDARFGEARDAYQALMEGDRKDEVDEVLLAGAKRARGVAVEVLDRCRAATGIGAMAR
jgi:tryptophanyl-tRNA synthetase